MADASSPNTVRSTSMVGRLGLPTSTQHMRVSNKATALRELQRSQKMHLIKLENMKPSIDMKQPKSYPHVQFNAKRMQMEAERNSAIGTHAQTHLLWGGRTGPFWQRQRQHHPPAFAAPPVWRLA